MPELVVYSREGCHLCEEMLDALKMFQAELGYTLKVYDIDEDDLLLEKYNALVPLVCFRGQELLRYHFELAAVETAIAKQAEQAGGN